MATVNINVYGRDYAIACDDGQEDHLAKLALMVNKRVDDLMLELGRAPEHTMLIYTALMLADELMDVTKAYKRLDDKLKEAESALHVSGFSDEELDSAVDMAVAENMTTIAERIEQMATQLKRAS